MHDQPAEIQTGFGPLLRRWRTARRVSQERLAADSEVSARHISFVENGRTAPSREMVLLLASALELPLRERNVLLGAAGFAPVYRESGLQHSDMAHVRETLHTILRHHEPFPAFAVNRAWEFVAMNEGVARAYSDLLEPPFDPIVLKSAMHAVFHPSGIRRLIVNWDEVSGFMMDRVYREVMVEPEGTDLRRLLKELQAYPDGPHRLRSVDLGTAPPLSVLMHLKRGDHELRFVVAITTLGTPLDVTLEELRVELYYPADEKSTAWIHGLSCDPFPALRGLVGSSGRSARADTGTHEFPGAA
jgi:transcriptional regulator with XRE-family HTH domain